MCWILRTVNPLWGGRETILCKDTIKRKLEAHRYGHSGKSCEEQGTAMGTGLWGADCIEEAVERFLLYLGMEQSPSFKQGCGMTP